MFGALTRRSLLRKSPGFTLIELIVVVVILGTLAVFSFPRYLSISNEARLSVLKSVNGSLHSAVTFVEAKAMLNDLYQNRGVGVKGTKLDMGEYKLTIYNKGTPREVWENGFEYLIDGDINHLGTGVAALGKTCLNRLCVIDNLKVSYVIAGKEGYGMFFIPRGVVLNNKECFVHYAFQIDTNGLLVYREIGIQPKGC
tara:strand:+ start:748 stop:1341 length:594 start_codon:yes stop_codon:yes gene_type:complete